MGNKRTLNEISNFLINYKVAKESVKITTLEYLRCINENCKAFSIPNNSAVTMFTEGIRQLSEKSNSGIYSATALELNDSNFDPSVYIWVKLPYSLYKVH